MAFELNSSLPINNGTGAVKSGGTLTGATAANGFIPLSSRNSESVNDYQKLVEVNSGNPISLDKNQIPVSGTMITFPLSHGSPLTVNNEYSVLDFEGKWIRLSDGATIKPTGSQFYVSTIIGPEATPKSTFLVGKHSIQTAN